MRNDFNNFIVALWILIKRIFLSLWNLLVSVRDFLLPVENSIKGMVSPEEFYRILILAISTGGSFKGFLAYFNNHFQEFITNPVLSVGCRAFIDHCNSSHLPVVFFVILFVGDYIRRRNHGK